MSNEVKCLFAWTEAEPTPPGIYCAYMNISQLPDGSVRVTIRERGAHPAPEAMVTIPASQVAATFR